MYFPVFFLYPHLNFLASLCAIAAISHFSSKYPQCQAGILLAPTDIITFLNRPLYTEINAQKPEIKVHSLITSSSYNNSSDIYFFQNPAGNVYKNPLQYRPLDSSCYNSNMANRHVPSGIKMVDADKVICT